MGSIKTYNEFYKCWEWKNSQGQLHRVDGPAVEYTNGTKVWYLNGQLHREDSPALEYDNGDKEWFLNDKPHREDGPAVEYADGEKEYWYHGKLIECKSTEEFIKLIKLQAFW